jgi:hypothetical protein
LDDQEPVVAPLEPYAMFHEDEGEDVNTQECSWVPSISNDEKFQEEKSHVNQVEISQQKASSFPITTVVQEKLDHIRFTLFN